MVGMASLPTTDKDQTEHNNTEKRISEGLPVNGFCSETQTVFQFKIC